MAGLINLPEGIVIEIFADWCDIVDLTRTDIAFCYKQRKQLLGLFSSPVFTVKSKSGHEVDELRWLLLRKIKLSALVLNGQELLLGDLVEMTSVEWLSKISYLDIFDCNESAEMMNQIVLLINSCTNLKNLRMDTIQGLNDEILLGVNGNILNSLEYLVINEDESSVTFPPLVTVQTFKHIVDHCRELRYFESNMLLGRSKGTGVTQADYIELLKANPNMMRANVHLDDNGELLVQTIIHKCPNVDSVEATCNAENCCQYFSSLFSNKNGCPIADVILNVDHGIKAEDGFIMYITLNKGKKAILFENVTVNNADLQTIFSVVPTGGVHDIQFIDPLDATLGSDTLEIIARNNPSLESITVMYTPIECKSADIQFLLSKCVHLSKVCFQACIDCLTDEDVMDAFSVLNSVTSLTLDCHETITADDVIQILLNNPKMTHISVENCPHIIDYEEIEAAMKENDRQVVFGPVD